MIEANAFVWRDFFRASDLMLDGLKRAETVDPIWLAEKLAYVARRSPSNYKILAASVSAAYEQWRGLSKLQRVALELSCSRYAGGVLPLIGLFNELSLWRLASLFSSQLKLNVSWFGRLFSAWLNGECAELTSAGEYRLTSLAYIHCSHLEYTKAMDLIAKKYAECAEPDRAGCSLQRLSFSYLKNRVLTSAHAEITPNGRAEYIASAYASPTRLKIALCVSGQMRAYKVAYQSWKHLGIENHDVDVFVHTWREVGWRFPSPISGNGAARAFSHRPFINAYTHCGALYGIDAFWKEYPHFMATLNRSCGTVCEEELREVYGPNVTLVVEDDPGELLGPDPKNQRRMFYKIDAAHQLAKASGVQYDLIIRIRPDKSMLPPLRSCDLNRVATASRERFCVFGEQARITGSQYVDDQFALGVPEVMDLYARTLKVHDQANAEKWFGFAEGVAPLPHLTLANSLFFQGVRMEPLQGMRLGPIVGDAPLSREAILELLMTDIGPKPRHRMDQILLESLS